MGKKSTKSTSQRLILAVENPTIDFDEFGFTFTMRIPPLTEEAKIAIKTYNLMRAILTDEDLENYKVANFVIDNSSDTKDEKEGGQKKITTEMVLPDLSDPAHQELVFSKLPTHQQNLLNNIAYLDTAIIKITKDKQELAVEVEGKVIPIESFIDFIKYVGSAQPDMSLLPLVDGLVSKFFKWRTTLQLKPVELKN